MFEYSTVTSSKRTKFAKRIFYNVRERYGTIAYAIASREAGLAKPTDSLQGKVANTRPSMKVGAFGNVFGIVVNMSDYGAKPLPSDCCSYTFTEIQKWIYDNHKIHVSKSSISSVKSKCGIVKIGYKPGKSRRVT